MFEMKQECREVEVTIVGVLTVEVSSNNEVIVL